MSSRLCLEVFAGGGRLSTAMKYVGLLVGAPWEAYPETGVVDHRHDIMSDENFMRLVDDIRNRCYSYIHFGIPCRSWGPAGKRNHGTRTKTAPEGVGALPRELQGNAEAVIVALLCRELIDSAGYFSIENPYPSYLWNFREITALSTYTPCFMITFDQCSYSLQLPASRQVDFCRKRTALLTNVSSLARLERKCPGVCATHQHEHAWGSRLVDGKHVKLTKLAGAYPQELCASWASLLKLTLA
jgi:hypothetical protein